MFVKKLIDRVEEEILGLSVFDQKMIDELMIEIDGTPNKSYLGANGMLAVSLAVARAAAMEAGLPLYRYLGWNWRLHFTYSFNEYFERRQTR
jgi:enolase